MLRKQVGKLVFSYIASPVLLFYSLIIINIIIAILTILSSIYNFFGQDHSSMIVTVLIGVLLIISTSISIRLYRLSRPRTICKSKAKLIINKLNKYKGTKIIISRSGQLDEIEKFSDTIGTIFKKSGWSVIVSQGPPQTSKTGLIVSSFDYATYCTKAMFVKNAFESAGIEIECKHDKSGNGNKGDIILYVTKKIKAEQCN